jgi:hypothetical protein
MALGFRGFIRRVVSLLQSGNDGESACERAYAELLQQLCRPVRDEGTCQPPAGVMGTYWLH